MVSVKIDVRKLGINRVEQIKMLLFLRHVDVDLTLEYMECKSRSDFLYTIITVEEAMGEINELILYRENFSWHFSVGPERRHLGLKKLTAF